MKEHLALTHNLLTEARSMSALATAQQQTAIKRSLEELINSLRIESNRQTNSFEISAQVGQQSITTSITRSEFRFYQRGDVATIDNRPDRDGNLVYNAQRCRQLLKTLLELNGQHVPDQLLVLSAPTAEKAAFDWPAWSVVLLIAIISAGFTYYQGTRTFNLLDNTYTLEMAWRIFNGELPYRDFTLVVAPGTFVIQALLMKLLGTKAIVGLYWCMTAMAATVLLTHQLLRQVFTPRWLAVALCLIPAFGGNAALPYPWYDVDTILCCLVSLILLLAAERRDMSWRWLLPVGIFSALPLAFKQNLGLAHLVMIIGMVNLSWLMAPWRFSWSRWLLYHAGVFLGLGLILWPFWWGGAMSALIDNTFLLAGRLRGDKSIINVIWDFFPLPFIGRGNFTCFIIGSALIWGAPVLGMIFWFGGTHKSTVRLLLPFWICGIATAGCYSLAQGSVMPLLPALALLMALSAIFANHFSPLRRFMRYLVPVVIVLLTIAITRYAYSGERLNFYYDANKNPRPLQSARLVGLSVTNKYATGLDEMLAFVDTLPISETIALIPTEDPVYFATGRRSPLRLAQRYPLTGGASANYLAELQRARPHWIIEKTEFQFYSWEKMSDAESAWLKANYRVSRQLQQYRVWKRNDL